MLSSCAGGPVVPERSSLPYAGPPLSVESSAPQHRVLLSAPSGGWGLRLDQTIRRFDHTDVFITLVRPNPAYMQTQAVVSQEVGTGVDPASGPIRVYARILAHDAIPGSQPYSATPPQP
jgi:hypothetical protein